MYGPFRTLGLSQDSAEEINIRCANEAVACDMTIGCESTRSRSFRFKDTSSPATVFLTNFSPYPSADETVGTDPFGDMVCKSEACSAISKRIALY